MFSRSPFDLEGMTEPGRRPRSLTSAVLDQLRDDILRCRLAPGMKLSTAAIAKRFDVSLAAVREALSRLVADGMVTAEDQRGFRVSQVSENDLNDIVETRIELESLALRRAIANGDESWRAELDSVWKALCAIPYMNPRDPTEHNEAWNPLHDRFHRTLIKGCDLAWVLRFSEILREQSERYRRLARPLGLSTRDPFNEHCRLVRSALRGDADKACSILREHYSLTKVLVQEAIRRSDLWRAPERAEGGRSTIAGNSSPKALR
ncbi:MAG: GntR family transcriptional regulator [Pseudorhodoplanes sp.]|uniref:GntR family transcriptional regulator n=1 Tax=Pseudorhodoplanes sp. TaxID=1934341 RepID=UPI003D0CF9D0